MALETTTQAIKTKTDNLPSDPASQSAVESKIDQAEANIRGADNDTLKTLSDQLDGVQADLDNPDQYKADVSGLAQESTVQEIKAKTDTIQWNDIKRILGLTQENFRLKNLTYDANKSLTSATIRVYANADDANNDQNPIAEYQISTTYDSEGKCTSYLVTKV